MIIIVDYFTKWAKVMHTYNNTGKMTTYFFFNHVISSFGVPQEIVMDHGKHLQNHMMTELASKLGVSN